jgi:WD40 repeat protein
MDVTDLARIDATLHGDGPAAVEAVLAELPGALGAAARRVVACHSHLLGPIEPAHARTDVLLACLSTVEELRPLVAEFAATLPALPRLGHRDLPAPHPALRRSIPMPRSNQPGGMKGIAPDGSCLAVAADGGLQLFDVATGMPRIYLDGAGRFDAASKTVGPLLTAMAIGPGGARVAAVTHWEQQLFVWDATRSEPLLRVDLPGEGTDVVFTPDGAALAVGTVRAVHLVDAVSGRFRATLDVPGAGNTRLGMSPDGTWIAVAYGGERTSAKDRRPTDIWDPSTGAVRTLAPESVAGDLAVAADGSRLLTAGGFPHGEVRIWDVATGDLLRETGTASLLLAGGARVVTCGEDRLRLWDRATGEPGAVLALPERARPVAVAPDGSWIAHRHSSIAWGDSHAAEIWDVATWAATERPAERRVVALPFATGTWVVTQEPDGPTRIVDAETGEVRHVFDGAVDDTVVIAPDGAWVAAPRDHHRPLCVWDTATWTERTVPLQATLQRFAAAPDGTWLATTDRSGRVDRWDTTGRHLGGTRCRAGADAVAIAPDGNRLAFADLRDVVRVQDVATGRTTRVLRVKHDPRQLAFLPDSRRLAVAHWGVIQIWDVDVRAVVAELDGNQGIDGLAVSPDGAWLAAAGRTGEIRVWRTDTWALATAMRLGDAATGGCAWLADGTGLSVSGDRTVYLLSFTTVGSHSTVAL